MTSTLTYGEKVFYQCDQCALLYAEAEWADKCEEWCSTHQSCNLEIIDHAVHGEPGTGQEAQT